MMIFLAIVAVVLCAVCAGLIVGILHYKRKHRTLSSYVKAVEDERNTYRREMSDMALQNQILVAKLEQIDKVLIRLGADSVRARIQPFLLSAGKKNGSR